MLRKVFRHDRNVIGRLRRLRFWVLNLLNFGVFGLITIENIAFQGYNLLVLSSSFLLGLFLGAYQGQTVTNVIEKNGLYRVTRKRLLLVVGLGILLLFLSIYGLEYGLLPLRILVSAFAFSPALFLGRFVVFGRWENRNNKEIRGEGLGRGIVYAIPRGLTWVQQFEYRWEIKQQMHEKFDPKDL